MKVLGIETSTAVCSAGLADESGPIAEHSIVESHIHSEKLLTLISELCEEKKIELQQLDGVAVSIGPGSFTGLRIGLSTAKGLCYAVGKPLIAVPAFESAAEAFFISHPKIKRVAVIADAKQGDYYMGGYEKTNGKISDFYPVRVGNLDENIFAGTAETAVITDRTDEIKKNADKCGVIDNILSYCRGDIVARIAIEKLKNGIENAPEDLEPMYLKDFIVRKH
ncbi:MAG: tRNA (adenosine(37)-N6)-threonylcarbamoyltransferase complex dimerization subunit type 1 TsaB [Bacteroidetes bacterium]|nr:tRNA (adenosine(37)-N6)-threonylcarbamoyltransferase complex dimerization subunit type 1 TsaB [Bacteroidota bacterium]